jgi:hypothetical protein
VLNVLELTRLEKKIEHWIRFGVDEDAGHIGLTIRPRWERSLARPSLIHS